MSVAPNSPKPPKTLAPPHVVVTAPDQPLTPAEKSDVDTGASSSAKGVTVTDAVTDALVVVVSDGVAVTVGDAVVLADVLGVTVSLAEYDGDTDRDGDFDVVPDTLGVTVGDVLTVSV